MRTSKCRYPENNPAVFPYWPFPFYCCLSNGTAIKNGRTVKFFPCVMKIEIANQLCIGLGTVDYVYEANFNNENVANKAVGQIFDFNGTRYDHSEVHNAAVISISTLLDNRPSSRKDAMEVSFHPVLHDIICIERISPPNGDQVPRICSLTEIATKRENRTDINTTFDSRNSTRKIEGKDACNDSTKIENTISNTAIPRTAIHSGDNTDNTADTNTNTNSSKKTDNDPDKTVENTIYTTEINVCGSFISNTAVTNIATKLDQNTEGTGNTSPNTDNSGNSTDESDKSSHNTATTDTGNTADTTAAGTGSNEGSNSNSAGDNTSTNTPGNSRASGSNNNAGSTTGNTAGTGTDSTTAPSTINTPGNSTRDTANTSISGNSASNLASTTTAIAVNITGNPASTQSTSTTNISGIDTDCTSGASRENTPGHVTDNPAGVHADNTRFTMASSSDNTAGSSTTNISGNMTSTSTADIAHTSAVNTTDSTSNRDSANVIAHSTCHERRPRSSEDNTETSGASPRRKKLRLSTSVDTCSSYALESVPVNIANTVTVNTASTSTASTEDINNSRMVSNPSDSERFSKKRSRSMEADPRKKIRPDTNDAVDSGVLGIGPAEGVTIADLEPFYREEETSSRAHTEGLLETIASIDGEIYFEGKLSFDPGKDSSTQASHEYITPGDEGEFILQNEEETITVSQITSSSATHEDPSSVCEEDNFATCGRNIILEDGNGSVLVGADISLQFSDPDCPLLNHGEDPHLPRIEYSSSAEEIFSTSLESVTIEIEIPSTVDDLHDDLLTNTGSIEFADNEMSTSSPVSEESVASRNLEVQPARNIPTLSPSNDNPTSVGKSVSKALPDADKSSSISPDGDRPRSSASTSYLASGEESHSEDISRRNCLVKQNRYSRASKPATRENFRSPHSLTERPSEKQRKRFRDKLCPDDSSESQSDEQTQRSKSEVDSDGSSESPPEEQTSDCSSESPPDEQRQRFRGKVGPGGSSESPLDEQRQRFRGKVGPHCSTDNPSDKQRQHFRGKVGPDDSSGSLSDEQRQRSGGKVGPGGSSESSSDEQRQRFRGKVGPDGSSESPPDDQRQRFRGKVGPDGSSESPPDDQRQRFRGKVGPHGSTKNPSYEQRQHIRGKVVPGQGTVAHSSQTETSSSDVSET